MSEFLTRSDRVILAAASLLLASSFAMGLIVPPWFGLSMAVLALAAIVFLVFCFPTGFCVAWLLITGMSLEMTLHDLIDVDAYQSTIAVVKGIEIGLGLLCVARFGLKVDALNPTWGFIAIAGSGLVHGLYPGLSAMDSLRSLIGSIAPFVFCFCRLPRSWAETMIQATKWCPLVAVVACLPLSAAGIRPLFVESGGARLAGLGHPAFLAGVCLPAIYACLIQLYREGRRGDLLLLIINGLILVLTGARAPLAYAVAVTGISLVTVRSDNFAVSDRVMLTLGTLVVLPLLVMLASNLEDVRLFNVVLNNTSDLSGRGLLWPSFEEAAAKSRWFGWGIGAGNAIIPPDGRVAQILHTWAAHNEYLRFQVEGGVLGETLLIALFAGWAIVRTRPLWSSDRRIMRLVFLALAGHAFTDNVLISTPACVMFAFATAVFVRGMPQESQEREVLRPRPDQRRGL